MAEKDRKSDSSGTPPKESSKPTEISKASVAELGAKLDEFAAHLSPDEQLTLATAFALASRGFLTFAGSMANERGLRVGIGQGTIVVERIVGGENLKLSDALADALCSRGGSRFSIAGLEVERPMFGAKSVAAGSKSVAACRNPGLAGAKSVAASCQNPGFAGAKSVAATCRTAGFAGAKSVAAACRVPATFGAKSVAAACRNTGLGGAKSVAATCRNPGLAGSKSVAANCRNPGLSGAKSVAACRMPGMFGMY